MLPKRWPLLLSGAGVLALLAFQGWLLGTWIGREARPPSWDQAIHLEIAHDYAALLAKGDLGGALRLGPKPGMPPFPPLFELSLLHWLGRPDAVTATLWANFWWLALLILSVWGLGLLYAGPWEAFGAAALIACAPETQWLARNHLSDLALAGWVAAAYLCYAGSAGLGRWGPALGFAACAAGGMLTKWSAWTYFLPVAFLWMRSLRRPEARWQAIVVAIVVATLCAPWYGAQAPILLPRLVEASADQAIPVWRGWAVFSYVWNLIGGLDAPFWALALVALVVPRLRKGRDDNWLIHAWFLSSVIFWTIVPNRQMRYLFPAVAPLALLVPGVFPRLGAALCAWQLLSAANFTYGWIKPVVLRWGPALAFFTSAPPARQDWRIGEILRASDGLRDPGLPFSNLALLANHERFNGPGFNWEQKRSRVDGIRIRGINSRTCELAEFVVIKEGSLGLPAVVNQLPEVRRALLEDGSWFQAGYEEAGSWDLPDGSRAALFRRRRRVSPPWKQPALKLAGLDTPQYSARDVVLKFGRWDPKRGAYDRAELSAASLVLRGVEVRGVKARLEGVDLVPLAGVQGLADVRLLRLERLVLEGAQVDAEGLAGLLRSRAPALARPSVRLDGTAAVSAAVKGWLPVAAEASLALEPRALEARVLRASLGPLPLPLPASVSRFRLSFEPNPELPFELVIPGLTIKDGRLSIP